MSDMRSRVWSALWRLQDSERRGPVKRWFSANKGDLQLVIQDRGLELTADLLGVGREDLKRWWDERQRREAKMMSYGSRVPRGRRACHKLREAHLERASHATGEAQGV